MSYYRGLSFDEANPFLSGAKRGGEIREQNIKNQYLPQTLLEELRNKRLVNQYYGPNIQNEMSLRSSQGNQANAYANHANQQARWTGPDIQSMIDFRRRHGNLLGSETEGNNIKNTLGNMRLDNLREYTNAINSYQDNPDAQTLGDQPSYDQNQSNLRSLLGVSRPEPKQFVDPRMQPPSYGYSQAPQSLGEDRQKPPVNTQQQNLSKLQSIYDLLNGSANGNKQTPNQKFQEKIDFEKQKEQGRLDVLDERTMNAEYKKIGEDVETDARSAKDIKEQMKEFVAAYRKTPASLKGPAGGMITKKLDENAEKADRVSKLMQVTAGAAAFKSRFTQGELRFMEEVKPNRALREGTVETLGRFMPVKSDRIMEHQGFMADAKRLKIAPEVARTLWSQYDNNMPVYDFEKDRINAKNLNKSRKYLTPEAMSKIIENGEQYNPEPENIAQENNMVGVITPDGQSGRIPAEQVEIFLKENPGTRRK